MSSKSTLSSFCFRIIIAFLVQEMIFVRANECFCQCNKRLVCDELKSLATSDDTNKGQWRKWNTYFMYLEKLHREFDPQVWSEKIISVENKTDSIGVLKRKLKDTESHVTRLEAALENVRKEFEKKMADFAQKMQDAQNQAMTLEGSVNKVEKKIAATQIQIVNIEARVGFVENQTNSFEQTIEEGKNFREQLGIKIVNIETRIDLVENQTNNFQQAIGAEEEFKELLGTQIVNIETRVGFVENQTNRFEQAIDAEEESKEQLGLKISTIETKANITENEINRVKLIIEAEKRARQHLGKLYERVSRKFASVENDYKALKDNFLKELFTVKEEIKTLKSDTENEKLVWNAFQEEIVLNTSKRFHEVEKRYENFMDDYETKLLNVDQDAKLLKLGIEEEKSARKKSEDKMAEYSQKMWDMESQGMMLEVKLNEAGKKITTLQDKMDDYAQKMRDMQSQATTLEVKLNEAGKKIIATQKGLLRNVKKVYEVKEMCEESKDKIDTEIRNLNNDTKILKSDIEEEKSARKKSEENVKQLFLKTSYLEMKDIKFQTDISDVKRRLPVVENSTAYILSDITRGILDREKLQEEIKEIKASLGRSRTGRALKRSLNEIRKGSSRVENKATPLETLIPMEQSIPNLHR